MMFAQEMHTVYKINKCRIKSDQLYTLLQIILWLDHQKYTFLFFLGEGAASVSGWKNNTGLK